MNDDRLLRMELREYEELVLLTSLGDRAKAMVRSVVVDGLTYTESGKLHGASRQAAAKSVQRFVAAVKRDRNYPDDWQATTLILPPDLARAMRYLHDQIAIATGLQPQYPDDPPKLTQPAQAALVRLLTTAGVAAVT